MAHMRKTLELYRDCLKLAKYISAKHGAREADMKAIVRSQFKERMHETDQAKIEEYRNIAIRALSNYMFFATKEWLSSSEGKEASKTPNIVQMDEDEVKRLEEKRKKWKEAGIPLDKANENSSR